ncbi:Monosaccharide-transporting ATPase [Xylanimonas cellulosilytica DSM 15894]|uniref:Xylose transport system permease protein XylH n=1 Tax=Xylanimonas cellulosilytica (strain DSM 15894 / JCM 12276 / CECT 5975 / KCTC 9989 / LMG 20990 / NBRC 107835 / XIL07) TaxID=446471 RepID=D1BWE2_XYLCX|nr:ABC transporter permease [Xylanimonas cellulosilytica]ACZ31487.1 Monosaccharide-transporting ATPase [Xylanimonas cellulosilytica DSM 15894]
MSVVAPGPAGDERVAPTSPLTRLLRRPAVSAAIAALVIMAFFSAITPTFSSPAGIATWLESAAIIGIMAVPVGLLMTAGEFDLSAGVMVGFSGLVTGVLTTHYGIDVWLAMGSAAIVCVAVGVLNGLLVTRTRLPSFIVTLGTFFVLQGVNLAVLKLIIGQVSIQGMAAVPGFRDVQWLLASRTDLFGMQVQASVWWWLLVVAVGTWVLTRTRYGNWIFAVGGAFESAREVGVPVKRTKVALFAATALCGWLVGQIMLFRFGTAQSSTGVGQELIYIICAVVGGCVMTGGVGSAIGPALGALIYGMANLGIVYAGWDNNWLKAFLGVMLLLAVLLNNFIRERAEGLR